MSERERHRARLQTVSVKLRVLTPDDWRVWRDVRLRALVDASEAFGASLAEWESADETRWRQRLADVPFNVVAIERDAAVGQASGTSLDAKQRVELTSMWVAREVRRTGIADALVAAVADHGRAVGAAEIRLSVRRRNEGAFRFYTRLGFEVADEPGDEPAEIAMVRALRP